MPTLYDDDGNQIPLEEFKQQVRQQMQQLMQQEEFEKRKAAADWEVGIRHAAMAEGVTEEEDLDKVVEEYKKVPSSDPDAPRRWTQAIKKVKAEKAESSRPATLDDAADIGEAIKRKYNRPG